MIPPLVAIGRRERAIHDSEMPETHDALAALAVARRGAGREPTCGFASLQPRASLLASPPDRMDLDEIALAVVKVVDVAAGLLHEHALDQLAPHEAVARTCPWHRPQPLQRLRELVNEQLLGVAMLAPPLVLGFEPALGFIEQDDLHGGLDTAGDTPLHPFRGRPRSRPAHDRATRAMLLAPRR